MNLHGESLCDGKTPFALMKFRLMQIVSGLLKLRVVRNFPDPKKISIQGFFIN